MSTKHDAIGDSKCGSCRFWHNPRGEQIGSCVLHPPAVFVVGMVPQGGPLVDPGKPPQMMPILRSYYPQLAATDGCHDHLPATGVMN